MKSDIVKNFKTADPQAFTAVMRQMGFASAACYRGVGESLALIFKTEHEKAQDWPAVVPFNIHYTPNTHSADDLPPSGWLRASEAQSHGNGWPKSTYLYFPEQFFSEQKLVFAVSCAPGKRIKSGELDGVMEALGARIRGFLRREREINELHEAHIRERLAGMGNDIQSLVDHELRTPLASIGGYLSLIKEINPPVDQDESEYWHVVDSRMTQIIDAMDRLSMALHGKGQDSADSPTTIDVRAVVDHLTRELLATAVEHVSEESAKKLNVQVFQGENSQLCIEAEDRMFRWATMEVLKNAIVYSRSGKVDIALYQVGGNIVIDVMDDGAGVSPGTEELIFLRFFQEPGKHRVRKGKRGLGLGLYLARQIVQRHMGELLYLRTKSATVFRFIWPAVVPVRKLDEKRGA